MNEKKLFLYSSFIIHPSAFIIAFILPILSILLISYLSYLQVKKFPRGRLSLLLR
jgi:hypothetical protein